MTESNPHSSWSDPLEQAIFALRYRRMDDFRAWLKELPSATVLDGDQENLLHKCARLCNARAMMTLLMWQHGPPDINGQNIRGETPLHVALESLNTKNASLAREAVEIVLMLVNARAELFLSDTSGNTPFSIVGKMLKCPAEVVLKVYHMSLRQYGNMPRVLLEHGWRLPAIFHLKNFDLPKRMLELCPDLVKPNSDGQKPNELLHLALEAGCPTEILKMLMDFGDLDVNAKFNGRSPLHVAAELNVGFSYYPHIKLLLEHGAQPKALDDQGLKPIHYTVKRSSPEVFEFLLAAAKESPRDDVKSWMPCSIHLAAVNGGTNIMKHLLTKTNIESRCPLGKTPLHYAARERNASAVYYLLAMGASVNAVDKKGWSALHHAAYGGECMKQGGDVVPVIGLLLHFGANVDLLNSDRRPALYLAIGRKNNRAIYQLVRHIALQGDRRDQTISQSIIELKDDLFMLHKKCLQELMNLSENGAANGATYLPMFRYTRSELILVASGVIQCNYLDHEVGGVKFVSKNFSPDAFPLYGNFLVSRIHHANLELMTLEEIGEIEDFNLLSDTLAASADEFVEFFQEKYLL